MQEHTAPATAPQPNRPYAVNTLAPLRQLRPKPRVLSELHQARTANDAWALAQIILPAATVGRRERNGHGQLLQVSHAASGLTYHVAEIHARSVTVTEYASAEDAVKAYLGRVPATEEETKALPELGGAAPTDRGRHPLRAVFVRPSQTPLSAAQVSRLNSLIFGDGNTHLQVAMSIGPVYARSYEFRR